MSCFVVQNQTCILQSHSILTEHVEIGVLSCEISKSKTVQKHHEEDSSQGICTGEYGKNTQGPLCAWKRWCQVSKALMDRS